MAEPRECFTYLAKNIQPWIKEVEKLELQMGEGVTAVTEVAVLANSNPKDDGLGTSEVNSSILPTDLDVFQHRRTENHNQKSYLRSPTTHLRIAKPRRLHPPTHANTNIEPAVRLSYTTTAKYKTPSTVSFTISARDET